jgi:hypothetical protein
VESVGSLVDMYCLYISSKAPRQDGNCTVLSASTFDVTNAGVCGDNDVDNVIQLESGLLGAGKLRVLTPLGH